MVEIHSAHNNHRKQFREVVRLFIEGKMNNYVKIGVRANATEESVSIETGKYRASLFMIHMLLKTMEHDEIADTLGVPCTQLRTWQDEKTFQSLIYSNYKEFLIYLGELYT